LHVAKKTLSVAKNHPRQQMTEAKKRFIQKKKNKKAELTSPEIT
jgi:hypothetical protein